MTEDQASELEPNSLERLSLLTDCHREGEADVGSAAADDEMHAKVEIIASLFRHPRKGQRLATVTLSFAADRRWSSGFRSSAKLDVGRLPKWRWSFCDRRWTFCDRLELPCDADRAFSAGRRLFNNLQHRTKNDLLDSEPCVGIERYRLRSCLLRSTPPLTWRQR